MKVKKTTTYRDLVDEFIEMPRIRDALDLDSIPAPSTLCKAFDRLEMASKKNLDRFASTSSIRYHEGTTGFKITDHDAKGWLPGR